jgi:hypothetical protein
MGIALGLAFAFVLSLVNALGTMGLIAHSADPRTTMIVFVGSFILAFGIGATVTGFVFMMMEGPLTRAWTPLVWAVHAQRADCGAVGASAIAR